MFQTKTVLDITHLPREVKAWARVAVPDTFSDFGQNTYHTIYPKDCLVYKDGEHLDQKLSLEEFLEEYQSAEFYYFLCWCIDQGQRDEFLLLYWW